MNLAMSVVPVSSVLIVFAEVLALVEILRGHEASRGPGGIALADGTH
jgi:TRAP-type C4-dicarboxylate transport system permease small subunit